jgi:hypothetical protein
MVIPSRSLIFFSKSLTFTIASIKGRACLICGASLCNIIYRRNNKHGDGNVLTHEIALNGTGGTPKTAFYRHEKSYVALLKIEGKTVRKVAQAEMSGLAEGNEFMNLDMIAEVLANSGYVRRGIARTVPEGIELAIYANQSPPC